jgi:hypothetical protein
VPAVRKKGPNDELSELRSSTQKESSSADSDRKERT